MPNPTDRSLQARTLLDDIARDDERRMKNLRRLLDLYPEVEPFWCDKDGTPNPKGWFVGFRLQDTLSMTVAPADEPTT